MSISFQSRRLAAVVALVALAAVGLALVAASSGATAAGSAKKSERLVVRGDDTVKDGPCPAGVCRLQLVDGSFRGTIGTGAYTGDLDLRVAEAFANGEGGLCAPIKGEIVLEAGSGDRLTLRLAGDSCQDGKGDVRQASFTGVARFVVKHGTGAYAKAKGSGLAVFAEDASDRERMTLIGRISR
jgi:hypothetical protein